jgi:hypothetical protein
MQSSTSNLRFAGDVYIKEVQLNSLNGRVANVTAQVEQIEIFEDLFSPFTTMSIVMRESIDYINLFPFVGEEYVDIDIFTPTMNKGFKGRYYIYKITNREYSKEKEVVYTIKAISQEFLVDANTKISKGFNGNISEIARSIMLKEGLNTQKNIVIDPATNKTRFTANYWTPSRCLNILSASAVDSSNSPSFLFFENRDGFNFRSINSILTRQIYQQFKKDNYVRDTNYDGVTSSRNIEEDYKRIISLSIPVVTDYMDDIQTGKIKSRMINYDILTKKYAVKDYSVKKDKAKPVWLNKNPAYSKYTLANAASTLISMPKHYNNFNNYIDTTNSKTMQRRLSFFKLLESYKVNIQVYGRTDYTVSQIVDLNISKATQLFKNENDPRDLIISGKYVVSALNHTITRDQHICNMELIKNSVLTDLSNE